jgi:mono/diheme cytochrome c family protein
MIKNTALAVVLLFTACTSQQGNNSKYTVAAKKTFHADGPAIFQRHCASCHNPLKDATGPALNKQLIENRTDEWVYDLLQRKKNLKKDDVYKARVKRYGSRCTQSEISKQELTDLLYYLRNPVIGY